MEPRSRTRTGTALLTAAALAAVAGCSPAGTERTDPAPSTRRGSAVSAQRCAANEAAGPLTYVTGYQFQSSVSILDPVAADALGYFDALCLDVRIQPGSGETAQNAQLVAAGTAQLSSIAGASDVLVNVANGVDVTAVALFGHVPVATLMTGPEVTDLRQLEGSTLGHKGALPVTIEAMLRAEGVDVGRVEQVVVGYDPTVLVRGQVDALTGYKSNEPLTLRAMGEEVTLWEPEDSGVPGSMATTIANPAFLAEHPTAVQDFLRAQLRAYEHCEQHAAECVGHAARLSQAGYDTEHNERVWGTETALVRSSQPAGQPLGVVDVATVRAEAEFLQEQGRIETVPDVEAVVDETVVPSLYEGEQLVWPAP